MAPWFKLPTVLRRADSEDATVTQQQASNISSAHSRRGSADSTELDGNGRTSESDESLPSTSEMSSGPPSSPSKNGKRSLFKRGSRNYHEKEGGGGHSSLSIAKRVKSSLHINSNVDSMCYSRPAVCDLIRSADG